ncbi:LPXTG cell wall anchor domain-containing protein [Enterococcus sp. OL5]|uniref:LPXTG cell wall anchor domain-containing protein n=1 Tax=Enterococcus sp. OL5 TaxID=2590214 RepID=UPI0011287917|nr:LPXTG cell wall anchor domain-containing protein [Enterococcus sp. OL5]TPR55095.1 LPXTG cell wall anchor domain-containing protein [Enterococcus sp. OL5]
MFEKIKRWAIATLMITVFSSNIAVAQEVQQVETNGYIGFTGVYEPIGTPDPTPPESIVRPPITEVAKPGGTLPQTNESVNSWLIWLGGLLISFVFLLWKRKRRKI